jgi:predicted RNA binding protein YcfA (HicA-like mRNA interferase family)
VVQYAEGPVPKKIRELKSMLSKAGFACRSGKGSHTVWSHPGLPESLTLSGNDGHDAKPYQEKQVKRMVQRAGGQI